MGDMLTQVQTALCSLQGYVFAESKTSDPLKGTYIDVTETGAFTSYRASALLTQYFGNYLPFFLDIISALKPTPC